MAAVPMRSFFVGIFLKSIIRARVFGVDVKTLRCCTDDVIRIKLKENSGGVRSVSVEAALADLKLHVKLDTNKADPRLRIVMLSAAYFELSKSRVEMLWKFTRSSRQAHYLYIVKCLTQKQNGRFDSAREI